MIGYIENRGTEQRPAYVSVVKHMKTGQWFSIEDHEITTYEERNIYENNAIVLFYKKKMSPIRAKEINNLKSQVKLMNKEKVKLKESELAYIPNYWYEKAISLAYPGMIHSSHLFCKHGRIKPNYYDCFPPKSKGTGNMNNTSVMGLDVSVNNMEKSFVFSLDGGLDELGNYTRSNIEKQSIKLPKAIAEYFLEKVRYQSFY